MERVVIELEQPCNLDSARRLADEEAARRLGPIACLAWFDGNTGRESPTHASECHGDCETPGWMEYALTRGASLAVELRPGPYVFCYRSVAEFL